MSLKIERALALMAVTLILVASTAILVGGLVRSVPVRMDDKVKKVTVEGELIENEGSGSKGIQNFEFKVAQVIGDSGKLSSKLKGSYLTFKEGEKITDLLKEYHHGDKLVLTGKLKIADSELEVTAFKKAAPTGSDTK